MVLEIANQYPYFFLFFFLIKIIFKGLSSTIPCFYTDATRQLTIDGF